MLRRTPLGPLVVALLCAVVLGACGGEESGDGAGGAASPAELVAEGEALYQETCAACHGSDLNGTDAGPPFLDPIYAPDHHSDEAFYAAVESGVQPHHWEFGAMPPQPSVEAEDVAAIVAYVRQQQAEAGITDDPAH